MLPPPPEDNNQETGSIPSPEVPNYMPEPEPEENVGVGSISPSDLFDDLKEGESIREAVTKELPSDAREEVILVARNLNVPDNDPLWAILLALQKYNRQLIEVGTATEKAKTVIVSTINDAPEKLNSAVVDIMRVTQINREEAIVNRENSSAGKTLIKWGVGIASGALLTAIISLALISYVSTSIPKIQEERTAMLERMEVIGKLQRIVGARMQQEGEKREFQRAVRDWQTRLEEEGETDENLETKEHLQVLKKQLNDREQLILKEEDNAFYKN